MTDLASVTPERMADAVVQARTGGMCHFGKTCSMCDCGRLEAHPDAVRAWDERDLQLATGILAFLGVSIVSTTPEPEECERCSKEGLVMPWSDGARVFCECGANVFRREHTRRFGCCLACNACGRLIALS